LYTLLMYNLFDLKQTKFNFFYAFGMFGLRKVLI
jgi:hypothetical protein